jgi:hypothetical protein
MTHSGEEAAAADFECNGDYAQTEVAMHYFWIADYTSM